MKDQSKPIDSFFVYGTLKRGQCREAMWPRQPLQVQPARCQGMLWGRQDYPAMMPGQHQVLGELWTFAISQLATVRAALDRIEGTTNNAADDLYHCHPVTVVRLADESTHQAYAYFYNRNPAADGFQAIEPIDDCQQWKANA
ncbi:gamma-glutamylcyclotransferase [Stieleria sp. TO1_6]|uniref:gamma-glutamylcyclotransferase family protein n=1 Tax=Stieleria tagensis TaxID=2956795 RepID=UPI00209AAF8A|nr:gamma-glutamylcyclotransferase family protein [Stieleria tagensis]MCO8121119.1 gamma-glutamylcyclotransferase [Stieleria tagensis]